MAIIPNTECYFLCEWMLNISQQRLTGPQTTLTNIIRSAALSVSSVTDQQWHDFNNYASWRNPYYLVYRDYQYASTNSLLTSLTNYYDFEGNSNDLVGSINGSASNVGYNTLYGKIGQGVRNTSGSGIVSFGNNTNFTLVQNTGIFAFNFWVRLSSLAGTYSILGNLGTSSHKGFYFYSNPAPYVNGVISNGSGAPYTLLNIILSKLFVDTSFHMVTMQGDGTYFYLYFDGVQVAKCSLGTLTSGNSTNTMAIFTITTLGGSSTMDFDEFGCWSRALTLPEIFTLFNGGAGVTYPF